MFSGLIKWNYWSEMGSRAQPQTLKLIRSIFFTLFCSATKYIMKSLSRPSQQFLRHCKVA